MQFSHWIVIPFLVGQERNQIELRVFVSFWALNANLMGDAIKEIMEWHRAMDSSTVKDIVANEKSSEVRSYFMHTAYASVAMANTVEL